MSRRGQEDSKPKVPSYIVTFSDMVTLLLTFFVMLLSLAQTQEKQLFKEGQQSFIRSLESFGLGMLMDREGKSDFDHIRIRHYHDEAEDEAISQSDTDLQQQLDEVFNQLERHVRTRPSNIVAQRTNYSATAVGFAADSADLSDDDRNWLKEFSVNLQQQSTAQSQRICVLGLARDAASKSEQWRLSAQRAQAVADFLKTTMPADLEWAVYSWGAGDGGQWVGVDSPISENSQIHIAVLQ